MLSVQFCLDMYFLCLVLSSAGDLVSTFQVFQIIKISLILIGALDTILAFGIPFRVTLKDKNIPSFLENKPLMQDKTTDK